SRGASPARPPGKWADHRRSGRARGSSLGAFRRTDQRHDGTFQRLAHDFQGSPHQLRPLAHTHQSVGADLSRVFGDPADVKSTAVVANGHDPWRRREIEYDPEVARPGMLANVREALAQHLEDDFFLLGRDRILLAANVDVGLDEVYPAELVHQLQQRGQQPLRPDGLWS